jgi:hypothetical protein
VREAFPRLCFSRAAGGEHSGRGENGRKNNAQDFSHNFASPEAICFPQRAAAFLFISHFPAPISCAFTKIYFISKRALAGENRQTASASRRTSSSPPSTAQAGSTFASNPSLYPNNKSKKKSLDKFPLRRYNMLALKNDEC